MAVYTTELIEKIQEDRLKGLLHDKRIFYRNQDGLRNSNIFFNVTQEERIEFARCYADPIYFIETYCYIKTPDGYKHVNLYDYQKDIIEKYQNNRFNIIKNSRQTGLTTIISLLSLWVAMFRYKRNILIMCNKMMEGVSIINRIKEMYIQMPFFLKQGIVSYNQKSLHFENNCRIMATVSNKEYASSMSIHDFFINDYAYINPYTLTGIFPTVASNKSNVFIHSTPNGYNQFYDLYTGAVKGENAFVATNVYWWQVPGRGEEWKDEQIKILGKKLFSQEYDLQFVV